MVVDNDVGTMIVEGMGMMMKWLVVGISCGDGKYG